MTREQANKALAYFREQGALLASELAAQNRPRDLATLATICDELAISARDRIATYPPRNKGA